MPLGNGIYCRPSYNLYCGLLQHGIVKTHPNKQHTLRKKSLCWYEKNMHILGSVLFLLIFCGFKTVSSKQSYVFSTVTYSKVWPLWPKDVLACSTINTLGFKGRFWGFFFFNKKLSEQYCWILSVILFFKLGIV